MIDGLLQPKHMEILVFLVLLGLIPASIARLKGRSFFVWWVYGTGLIHRRFTSRAYHENIGVPGTLTAHVGDLGVPRHFVRAKRIRIDDDNATQRN
jgi:hypothetical protein